MVNVSQILYYNGKLKQEFYDKQIIILLLCNIVCDRYKLLIEIYNIVELRLEKFN